MRRTTPWSLAVALLAAAGGTLALAASAGADETFTHVETATAGLLVSSVQRPGLTPFSNGVVDDATAYTASVLDSGGGSEAQAATVYPGALVVQGPALLCHDIVPSYFGTDCPVDPPDYPLLADATYPTHPHDTAAASGSPVSGSGLPLTVTPGEAEATAAATGSTATTRLAHAALLAGTPTAVTAGSAVSLSSTKVTGDVTSVHVQTVLHDVTVASALHVATVTVTDDLTVSPGRRPTDTPHVRLAGVTVAGQPATIDERGVHVAGQPVAQPPPPLAGRGVTVRLVGADRSDHPGGGRSTATGLVVTAAVPVSAIPSVPDPVGCPPDPFPCPPNPSNLNATYLVSVTVGSVGALAESEPGMSFDLGAPLLTVPSDGAGGGIGPTVAPAPFAGQPPPTGLPPAGIAPVVASGRPPRLAPSGLLRVSLDALYAVLALVTAACFVGWRAVMTLAAGRRR